MMWITGAKGLLGSALCAKCTESVKTGSDVDIASVMEAPGVTHIINAAAFSLVDKAETERKAAFRTNVLGPQNLSRLAKEIGARFIHISTDYVFSGQLHRPLTENDLTVPCNYYGVTKLQGEERLSSDDLIIRTSALFGDGGKNFVSQLLRMLLTETEIRLVNDHWNRPTYAPDLADAILQMQDFSGLYHFANAGICTKYEFGLAMREEAIQAGFPVVTKSIIPVPSTTFPSPCKRPVYSAFDTTKIEKHISIRHWRLALKEFLGTPLCQKIPTYL